MTAPARVRWPVVAGLAPAVLAPVVVLVGSGYAAAAQPPGYDPVRQTLSALANRGATDRWIMVSTLLVLGLGYLVTAVAVPAVPARARVVLGAGGAAVTFAALFSQPATGSSAWHMGSAALGWLAFTCWPLAVSRRRADPPLLGRGPAWVVTAVLVALLCWFGLELLLGGTRLGLAQRVLVLAQTVWPATVAVVLYAQPASAGRRFSAGSRWWRPCWWRAPAAVVDRPSRGERRDYRRATFGRFDR